MCTILDLGMGISLINVYYSLAYILMWCIEQQADFEGDNEPFVWLAVYTCNVFLNAFLFLGLRKRDRLALLIWCSLTLLWFVPKLYEHVSGAGSKLNKRGATYQTVNLFVEVYIGISLAIMLLVYIYLPSSGKPKVNKRLQRDIPLEELNTETANSTAKTKEAAEDSEELQACLPSTSSAAAAAATADKLVISFDFHCANDDN
ncbi:maker135 [Drosophila busckii]|uniref:Maker135 n=1 Tax=Drosophila busckii TaxID=30019 RepID=A0A0M4E7D3_DROBS|nr:maker135 [Drosophila busckii]